VFEFFFVASDWLGNFLGELSKFHNEILAVATIFIAIFTIVLACVARRQIKLTKILERAYLSVAVAGIRPFLSLDGRLSCDVWFRNTGHLPAQNVSWFLDWKFSSDAELNDFPIPANAAKFPGNNLIPPGSRIRKGSRPIMHTELDSFMAKPDKAWLYVWGRVRYRDGFKRGLRFTDFCFRYNLNLPKSTWTIGASHGRQHEYGNRTDEE
jgi:hypothetical protein